jgi:hypothetical protein
MILENFEILMTSYPDKNNLVAEIWYHKDLLCTIYNEDIVEIEFYKIKSSVKFSYESFVMTLEKAKANFKVF